MGPDAILGRSKESIPEKQRRWVLAPQPTGADGPHSRLHQSCSSKLCTAQAYNRALYVCVITIEKLHE